MTSASRRRRREALRRGLCPSCLERPITHEVRVRQDGVIVMVACVECWPDLRDQLRADGVALTKVNGG